MKRISLLILAAVLSLTAGVQTAMAQKVTLYSAGSKAYECDIARLDSIVFSEGQTIIPDEEIVVTVDAYGNADGEHLFEKIDETNFYIDDIKYTAQSGDLVVTGYNQAFFKGTANIISVLKYRGRTMNVVGIGNGAFGNCTSLTSITIPESVTSIGNDAFYRCSSLTSVTIPSSVTSIGSSAFFGCSSLTSIIIPSSVTSIGDSAFSGCSSLTSITIPESVTSIGNYAFYGSTSLTSITIPESVTSIGNGAFAGCSGLTSITIPNSVTSIGERAFSGCSSLTSVTIPNSVTSIGTLAFYACTSLTSVHIADLTAWCSISFSDGASNPLLYAHHLYLNGKEIIDLVIPDDVTSISNYAFSGCTSLTSITLPESVTSIGNYAFYGSTSLTSVTIPESVTSIEYCAFSGCSGLTDVYCYAENVPSTDSYAFDNSPISSATLHVPAGSVSAYKAKYPWKNFGSIVAIE